MIGRKSMGCFVAALVLVHASLGQADSSDACANVSIDVCVKKLQTELRELRAMVLELRNRNAAGIDTQQPVASAKIAEDMELISSKVQEQYQTKVESGSKYRVRFSGAMLLNLFSNIGSVDSIDVPSIALPRGADNRRGSFGGSVRQSQFAFEAFGPEWLGAQTSADVQFDFAGGFAQTVNGNAFGLVRLRTASATLDWGKTTLLVGQADAFFSPLSPTSYASFAHPALAYTGNLWSWAPQLRLEHRIGTRRNQWAIQAGILDSYVGEPPYIGFYRLPQAGESSRQPAYAVRIGWQQGNRGDDIAFGVASYYGRQNWAAGRNVDGWAVLGDVRLPLGLVTLTGEIYRGQAVGGIGGAIGRSVVTTGLVNDATTRFQPLDSIGGWLQAKLRVRRNLEFNVAAGHDNAFAEDVRVFPPRATFDAVLNGSLLRNQSAFVNFVYRPRSNLIMSIEDRYVRTYTVAGREVANQTNATFGVLF